VLTVDYERLGVRRGELLLDLGCGGGRHAFGALRLGARVVALDARVTELANVRTMIEAMRDEKDVPRDEEAVVVQADALRLPFADASFDRIIASEVLEHIEEDQTAMSELARVLRPGGTMAVTVPRLGPETVNWALSREYHEVEGGHVRIYRRSTLLARLQRAGLEPVASHHAHALHTPYWWLRCWVGPHRDDHLLVRAYHRVLVWDIVSAPRLTRVAEHLLNPVLGKSLVVYLMKPDKEAVVAGFVSPTRHETLCLGRSA
jgi:SAM-dependent methyltransferase